MEFGSHEWSLSNLWDNYVRLTTDWKALVSLDNQCLLNIIQQSTMYITNLNPSLKSKIYPNWPSPHQRQKGIFFVKQK